MISLPFFFHGQGLPASGRLIAVLAAAISATRAAHGTWDIVLLCLGSQLILGLADIFGQGPGFLGIRVCSCHQCTQLSLVSSD